MSSQNQSCIVHIKPTSELVPIVFNDKHVENCCQFKNKFGEFVCNEKIKKYSEFCEKHFDISFDLKHKFYKIINTLLKKENSTTIDDFMNIFYGIYNCFFKHRELFICFSANKTFIKFTNLMVEKLILFRNKLMSSKKLSLKIHKKSMPIEYHLEKLSELLEKSNEILINKQIDKARTSLIANNIKINKLSEIHLRIQPNSNDIRSVISKGIDKKILSFF